MNADLKITEIKAFPTSFPVPPKHRVALGIGTAIKRDAVQAARQPWHGRRHLPRDERHRRRAVGHPRPGRRGVAGLSGSPEVDRGIKAFNLQRLPCEVDRDGNVWPLDKPGLGLEVDEEFLKKHPAIEGPGYI